MEEADVILLWGSNARETHPIFFHHVLKAVRRGAKLLHAFGESSVPRVTLVTRKIYGGAYIAMNSRSLNATKVFAWPDAEVAVMGAKAAVGILHKRKLAAVEDAAERDAVLRRRLEFLSEPGSFFYEGSRPLRADDIADPYRRGIFISARATNRAERAWLTDMLSAGDPTTEGNQP